METIKKRPVTVALMIINLIVFILVEVTGGSENIPHMLDWGAMYVPWVRQDGEWYRLFTCMFLHFGTRHLINNMLVLFVLGLRMEPLLGSVRMLILYLLGGIGGNLVSMLMELRTETFAVSAGASGAVFALMGAMIFALIRGRGRVQDLDARQVIVMALLSLYLGFASEGTANAAHVGGLASGFLLAIPLLAA